MEYFAKKLQAIEAAKEERQASTSVGALQGEMGAGFKEQQVGGKDTGAPVSFADDRKGKGGFKADTKSYSRTMQGDDPRRQSMRDDYGWKMTGSQYEDIEKGREKFEGAINQYHKDYTGRIDNYKSQTQGKINEAKGQYDKFKSGFKDQYESTKSEFDKATKTLGSMPTTDQIFNNWYNEDLVNVGVYNDQFVEGWYKVPKSVVKGLTGKVDGSNWVNANTFGISVKQQGRTRGAEMHKMVGLEMGKDALRTEFWKDEEIQGNYRGQVSAYRKAESQLNNAKSQWMSSVAKDQKALSDMNTNIQSSQNQLAHDVKVAGIQRDTDIGKATSARQAKVDVAKANYVKRTVARRKAYQGMQNFSTTTQQPQAPVAPGQENTNGTE